MSEQDFTLSIDCILLDDDQIRLQDRLKSLLLASFFGIIGFHIRDFRVACIPMRSSPSTIEWCCVDYLGNQREQTYIVVNYRDGESWCKLSGQTVLDISRTTVYSYEEIYRRSVDVCDKMMQELLDFQLNGRRGN